MLSGLRIISLLIIYGEIEKILSEVDVVYSWTSQPTVAWPNKTLLRENENKKRTVIGIKVWEDTLYLTLPRWYGNSFGVNVGTLPTNPQLSSSPPEIQAWPSFAMQSLGDCNSFQFVQSMEIQREGVIWLPDNGREFRARRNTKCSPKLLIMDIKNKQVIHRYDFPPSVVSATSSFLNDITIDTADRDNMFAYISDSNKGRLVVYSRSADTSWTIEHSTMKADIRAASFDFLNPPAHLEIQDNNINGLAVSPTSDGSTWLYYSPLTSLRLFRVGTKCLKDARRDRNLEVEDLGAKFSQTDGFAMGHDGTLYLQEITNNSVTEWNTTTNKQTRIAQDNSSLIWPDTMALDQRGFLWASTRGWPLDSGSRLVQIQVGSLPYDY